MKKGKQIDKKKESNPCQVNKKCGGCRMLYLSYEEQLKNKQDRIREVLQPYCKPEAIVGAESPFHYRNRVQAVFKVERGDKPVTGIYEEGTRRIIPTNNCLIDNEKAQQIMASVANLLKSFKVAPYYEDTGYGLLRHVMIRVGQKTGEVMVVLVLGSPVMPSKSNFVKALLKIHPEITTIIVNVNNRGTGMSLGSKTQVLHGKGYIEDILCEKAFRIYPKTMYPLNTMQAENLYTKILEFSELKGTETVMHAYCGLGIAGLLLSEHAKQVIGADTSRDMISEGSNNAKYNGIKNIQFYQNEPIKILSDMSQQNVKVDLIVLEPTRNGCDEKFLSDIIRMKPKKLVVNSNNLEALAKDLKYMTQNGYKVKKAQGIDYMPNTGSVQCIVQLSL